MKKFLDILLVRRPEVESKWWHRLVTVLIYGSTIVLAICAITINISNNTIQRHFLGTPSLLPEQERIKLDGIVQQMVARKESDENIQFVVNDFKQKYGGIPTASSTGIVGAINEARLMGATDGQILSEIVKQNPQKEGSIQQAKSQGADATTILNEILKQNQSTVLQTNNDNSSRIGAGFIASLKNVALVLLVMIGWFIFWESIVYRTVLYIAYGKQKNNRG